MADSTPGNIPIPDPSLLTTEQLRRELGALRELFETRLDAIDKATELVAREQDRQSDHVNQLLSHQREDRDRDLAALRESMTLMIDQVRRVGEERFAAVDSRFNERDVRIEQQQVADRISLAAALAAAKEAVGAQNESNTLAINKSDAASKEKIDSLVISFGTSVESLNDKITALNSRMDRNEGKSQGGAALWAAIIAVVTVLLIAGGLVLNASGK